MPRPLIYLIILTTLIGALTATYHAVYDAGYTKASQEALQGQASVVKTALREARESWATEARATEIVIQKETQIVEVVKTVYKDVYKTKYVCKDVGSNVIELLNRPIKGFKRPLEGDTHES